jgi:hypothetical protein
MLSLPFPIFSVFPQVSLFNEILSVRSAEYPAIPAAAATQVCKMQSIYLYIDLSIYLFISLFLSFFSLSSLSLPLSLSLLLRCVLKVWLLNMLLVPAQAVPRAPMAVPRLLSVF